MVYASLALLVFSILLIYKASEWVIRYSVSLSRILGISTFVIGFILVAISTSLPELFVTILAALEGEVNLAVGDILGSNMFNINAIIGITTIFVGAIHIKKKETLHLAELLFVTSALTLVILSLPALSILHGIVLLVLFGYLIVKLWKRGKVEKEIYEDGKMKLIPKGKVRIFDFFRKEKLVPVSLKFLFAVAVLLWGAKILVDSSLDIAFSFGLTTTFIGATLVAFGTSIPELSVTLAAVKKRHYALAMGDLIGSAVANITLVLGVLAIMSAVPLDTVPLFGMLPFLLLSSIFVWYVFSKKRKVTKFEGTVLLVIYAAFILEQLGIIAVFG